MTQHKIGTRDDMERLDIAGHDERDAPLQSLGSEPAVDQVGVLAADDDGDVPRIEENIAPLQLRTNGVAAPNRESVAIGIKKLTVKSLEGVADRDHEIDRARKLRGEDRRTAPRHDVELDVGSQRGNLLHQRRHQKLHREIGIIRRKRRSLRMASKSSGMKSPRT